MEASDGENGANDKNEDTSAVKIHVGSHKFMRTYGRPTMGGRI